MGAYNFNLLKDELSLSAWLAVGACVQAAVSFLLPARYSLLPLALTACILAGNLAAQYSGIVPNAYLKKATLDRWSILFPEKDGSRPAKFGDKPIAMFLVGIRSNHPLGRLHPTYRKLNDYMDDIYKDAEDNRRTNGCKFSTVEYE